MMPCLFYIEVAFQEQSCTDTVRPAGWMERFILTVKCNTGIDSICRGSPFWGQWKREAVMTRHHVGHQPFMKAPLLGTLSSRHLLCPTLHRGSDPKTVFFSEPEPIYVSGPANTNGPSERRAELTGAWTWRELLTSIQEVVDALVFPQGRKVQIIHQRIQAILWGEEKG